MCTKGYIEYNNTDVHIFYVDMPCSVTSSVVENADGSYNIYINSRLSYEEQLKGYMHEINHIHRNDFECNDNIHEIEIDTRER